MVFKAAPLPHEWMIVSIIGFFVSLLQVWDISMKWGAAFMLIFIIMFFASVVSMTKASTDNGDLDALAVHYKTHNPYHDPKHQH